MAQLGANAHGEVLEPGRVPDCYLGLLLRADAPDQAPGVLVVSPTGLLHPVVPQPDGTLPVAWNGICWRLAGAPGSRTLNAGAKTWLFEVAATVIASLKFSL